MPIHSCTTYCLYMYSCFHTTDQSWVTVTDTVRPSENIYYLALYRNSLQTPVCDEAEGWSPSKDQLQARPVCSPGLSLSMCIMSGIFSKAPSSSTFCVYSLDTASPCVSSFFLFFRARVGQSISVTPPLARPQRVKKKQNGAKFRQFPQS